MKILLLCLSIMTSTLALADTAKICQLMNKKTVTFRQKSSWTAGSKWSQLERLGVEKDAENQALMECANNDGDPCFIKRTTITICDDGRGAYSYQRGECSATSIAIGCK